MDGPLPDAGGAAAEGGTAGAFRWWICGLLLAATTINYIDRQVLGVLAPDLGRIIGWNEIQYGYIVSAFQAAYAIGLISAGALVDRVGARIGYAVAIGVWSLAAIGHSLATTALGFGIARFFMGLGEAGNMPAAVKTVTEWFPRQERAFATGIFNAGTSVGAVLAPLFVPIVAVTFGWRAAFVVTSVLSAAWLILWLRTYRPSGHQPAESADGRPSELAAVRGSELVADRPRLAELLRHRQTWAFIAGKVITDPIWWIFLFWLPKFLNQEYGLSLLKLGPPLIVIYLMADAGSVGGGWLAGQFLRRGWSVNRARKTTMLLCALAVTPVALSFQAHHLWLAVGLIGLATAAHQGWSVNQFTLPSDLFPQQAVASVVGIGGFAGAVSGMCASTLTGLLLQATGSYIPIFIVAATAYLVALVVIHTLVPRMEPAMLRGQT
jgi:ACS family hexuronate transporter-like MFS transporter